MKANEKKLGDLHGILAEVLANQVSEKVIEVDADGKELTIYTATPALLTVASRFLKDNDITCEVGDSKGLSDLKEELAKRKRRSDISKISHIDEAMNG